MESIGEIKVRYAVWYANSSGYLEAFKVIEAASAEVAINVSRSDGLGHGVDITVTEATDHDNGFGNDPNLEPGRVVAASAGRLS